MGWGRGSEIMSEIIDTIQNNVKDKNTRKLIYKELVETFESYDCDTLEECLAMDDIYDKALKEIHPDWDWE
jgi:hypothetical protein